MSKTEEVQEFQFADNVFGFVLHKPLCEKLFDHLRKKMKGGMKGRGRISIYIEDLSGKPPKLKALSKDFRFELDHADQFYRVAFVTHNRALRSYAKLKDYFMEADVRTYPSQQRVEALSWISGQRNY